MSRYQPIVSNRELSSQLIKKCFEIVLYLNSFNFNLTASCTGNFT